MIWKLNRSIKELLAWLFRLGIMLWRCACSLMLACQVIWHESLKKKIFFVKIRDMQFVLMDSLISFRISFQWNCLPCEVIAFLWW